MQTHLCRAEKHTLSAHFNPNTGGSLLVRLSLYLCKASETTRPRITTNSFVKNMCFFFILLNFSMQEQKHLKYF